MTEVTVKLLAAEIQTSVDRLVQQLGDAGFKKSENDFVSPQEKEALLIYLNSEHGNISSKLTLQRKTRTILNIPSTDGKNKSVRIEVRKKRTYLKGDKIVTLNKVKTKQEKDKLLKYNQEKGHIKKQNKFEVTYKTKSSIAENSKVINKNINKKTQSNYIDKARREAESAALKRKSEAEALRKLEEDAKRVSEEARKMAEANEGIIIESDITLDNSDYHVTTSYHAREAEDENDRQVESGRTRSRTATKTLKQKKANKLSESKVNREEERAQIRSSNKNKRKLSALHQSFNRPDQVITRDVIIGETISIAELANKMAIKGSQVIKAMINMGTMVTINQIIPQKTAKIVAEKMGHKVILRRDNELEEALMSDRDTGIILAPRAPVVTIMGHVDHGKTSLLDYIRSTKVALGESGGITQHIGAYKVHTNNGFITFLDTPGHSAFTSMRARGAQATDIVILVVAADDGVMPQTIEAIQHANAAKVPIVVAVNKIDKPEANIERIKTQLSKYGVMPEEWGGQSQFIPVSAKIGTGINDLLDAILLQAEILELQAINIGMARGVVIESFLDKGRGPVATILVQEGTLNKGDIVLCGFEYGRVRAMRDELGYEITSVGPSIPVEILGLSSVLTAGDQAIVVRDEKKAREVALYRQGKFREVKIAKQQKSNLENIFVNIKEGNSSELNIIIKSDVNGSCEAISHALLDLSTDEVKIKIIGSGVGSITETDATLANASNAIILGFNVRADASARRIIETENLDLRYYSVIYDLIYEIKKAMSGMLTPEYRQEIIGLAEVRNVFKSPKFGAIAGCTVIEGIVKRHNPIRVLRDNVVIYEGNLESLRRFKEDINEASKGMECGIGIKKYNDVRSSDIIEVLEIIEVKRTIN
ncbi:translation initiation factor IF-2 [Candidatus Profftia sp. (ex Adelges kitamiensis)]|uniref:translation initiation factor IF-2 n=1 Tax=Candidatus Profftia sp. (ex Adelges kitamiensis) TaxID=2864218 RepID=UPI001CE291CC|nr:translation initiation factor IF-2 [Candidatus Profftia sp. (ex Adelges kitamiensis)]